MSFHSLSHKIIQNVKKNTIIEFIREYSAMWWRVKIILKSTVNMVKDKYERITDWDGIYI